MARPETHRDMAAASRESLDRAIKDTAETMRRYADELERDCARSNDPAQRASSALAAVGHMMTNIDMRGIAYWAASEARDTAAAGEGEA